MPDSLPRTPGPSDDPESSIVLLDRFRAGDHEALDRLLARHLGPLQRWARGRLPRGVRDLQDTGDLVQETLIQALKHLDRFEYRGEGALQAYLRQAVYNRIRMEFRRFGRHPQRADLDDRHEDAGPSPLEEAMGRETLERYEKALAKLSADDREAVIAKIELGCGYADLARILGKPSADAARMAVGRALVRLAEGMKNERG